MIVTLIAFGLTCWFIGWLCSFIKNDWVLYDKDTGKIIKTLYNCTEKQAENERLKLCDPTLAIDNVGKKSITYR